MASPKNNVCVYIGQQSVPINVRTCDVELNPIIVMFGEQYDTNATRIYMDRGQAQALANAILAQLQGDAEADSGDDGPGVDLAAEARRRPDNGEYDVADRPNMREIIGGTP